jgi:hypothetical protein
VRLAAKSATNSLFPYAGDIIVRFIDMVTKIPGGAATASMP